MRYMLLVLVTMSVMALKSATPKNYALTTETGKYIKLGAGRYLLIPVTLANNTDDTLQYASMSCGWNELYKIDSKTIGMIAMECDKNIPVLLKLLPHSSKSVQLKCKISSREASPEIKYRVGFNLLIARKGDSPTTLIDNKKKNIIWADKATMTLPD